MNSKIRLTMVGLMLCSSSFAQQKLAPYQQEIKGTRLTFKMQAIPGGTYQMGSASGKADELPVHKVQVADFWMAEMELSWDIYEPFVYKDLEVNHTVGAIPEEVDAVSRPSKPYLDMTFGMGKEGYPALAMTHYNAIQFCKWLYARTGVFYRLPTEAEWEYACRSGSNTMYAFGDADQLADYAWYKENSGGKTHPVGQKKANKWGLHDMHGNVAEWTYDQYVPDFYSSAAATLPDPVAKPEKLYAHVIRGGSYDDDALALRSSSRQASDPSWKQLDPQIPKSNWWFPEAPFVGMRLVRPFKIPSAAEIEAYYNPAVIPDF